MPSTSGESSRLSDCTASSQDNVVYDPHSDIVLCKIDEHSIRNCLMSEFGKDMLMRTLILEAGNKRQLIEMLSSEIDIEELKVLFPRMFLSQSVDNLNSIHPDIVVKERSQLLNSVFHRGVNTTFQAFLSYMRKNDSRNPVEVMSSDIGQSVAERKKVFESSSRLVPQREELVGNVSDNIGSLSDLDSDVYLEIEQPEVLYQEVDSVPSTSGGDNIYESIDDVTPLSDGKDKIYESVSDFDEEEEKCDSSVSSVASDYYEEISFYPNIKQDQAAISSFSAVQNGEGEFHTNPMYDKTLAFYSKKRRPSIERIDHNHDVQSIDIASESPQSSMPSTSAGVVVRQSRTLPSIKHGVSNFILRNRISMQTNILFVRQYMMDAEKKKDLLKLLVLDAGGMDQLIKILVSEIGEKVLMQIFPTISRFDIESSLSKKSCDVIVRSGNTLLRSNGSNSFIEEHLLKTFISYIKENYGSLGFDKVYTSACAESIEEDQCDVIRLTPDCTLNLGQAVDVVGEQSSSVDEIQSSFMGKNRISPDMGVYSSLESEDAVSTRLEKSSTASVIHDRSSAGSADETQSSFMRKNRINPNHVDVYGGLGSESPVSTRLERSPTASVMHDRSSTGSVDVDGTQDTEDAEYVSMNWHHTDKLGAKLEEAPKAHTVNDRFSASNSSETQKTRYASLGWKHTAKLSTELEEAPKANTVNDRFSASSSGGTQKTEYANLDWKRTAALEKTRLYNVHPKEDFVPSSKDSEPSTSTAGQTNMPRKKANRRYFVIIDQVYSDIRNLPPPIDTYAKLSRKVKKSASMSIVETNRNTCSRSRKLSVHSNDVLSDRIRIKFWKNYECMVLNTTILQNFVGCAFDALYGVINQTLRITDELYYCDGYALLNWVMDCIRNNSDISRCNNLITNSFSPCIKYYQSITSIPYYKNLPLYVGTLKLKPLFDHVKVIHELLHTGRTSSNVLFLVSKGIVKDEVLKYMKRIRQEDIMLLRCKFDSLGSDCICQANLKEFIIKDQLVIPYYAFEGIIGDDELNLQEYNVVVMGDIPFNVTLRCNSITVYGNVKGNIISDTDLKIFGSVYNKATIKHQSKNSDCEVFIKGDVMQCGTVSVVSGVLEIYGDVKGNVYANNAGVIVKGNILNGSVIDCRNGMYLYVHSGINDGCFYLKEIPYVFFDKNVNLNFINAINSEFYFKENTPFTFKEGQCLGCRFHCDIDKKFKKFDIQEFKALMKEKLLKLSTSGKPTVGLHSSAIQSSLSNLSSIRNVRTGRDVKLVSSCSSDVKIKKLSDLKMI